MPALPAAVLLGWLFEDLYMGTAALTFVGVAAALAYAVTALRARPIVTWALHRTLGSVRQLLPTVTRALPLLIVFVTFLFINGEVWHVSSRLDGGVLWLVVLLFTVMGVGFFLVRLTEQIDKADDELDDARIAELVGVPALAAEARRLAGRRPDLLLQETGISRFERLNLTVALVVIQLSQVLLVSVSLLLFLLVFGSLAMKRGVVEDWIGQATTHVPGLPNVSVELLQVSIFLAAFSALYISVAAVTDETYRSHFFAEVLGELERAIATRAAYNAVRADRGDTLEDDPAGTPVKPLGGPPLDTDAPTMPLQPVTPAQPTRDARTE